MIAELVGEIIGILIVAGLPLIFMAYIFSLTPIGKVFIEYLRKKLNAELISKKDYQILENRNKQLESQLLEYEQELNQLREAFVFNKTHQVPNLKINNNINLEKN